MLTLKDIKKNIVKTNNVETITFGDIYKNWNVKEIKYPSININLESSTIVNGSVTYNNEQLKFTITITTPADEIPFYFIINKGLKYKVIINNKEESND